MDSGVCAKQSGSTASRERAWVLTILLTLFFDVALAQSPTAATPKGALEATGLLVPAGTIIPMELENTINSRTAYDEQKLYCKTICPIAVNDHILVPAGSYVIGEVTEVVRPGKVIGKAQLGLRFDSIILPSGVTRDLQGRVFSIGGARLEDSKKDQDLVKNDGSGGSAVAQAGDAVVDAGGLGGANPLSAVSEGVGGLILMLATRGKTIILRPGTTMEIKLTAPLNVGPKGSKVADAAKEPELKHRPSDSAK